MTHYKASVFIEDLAFPEGPRWHQGRFWFTDQHDRKVYSVHVDGVLETIAETADLPGGLCWLPDGTLLVVYMTQRKLMRIESQSLTEYANLSSLASFHCNDVVADKHGNVYAGNFGFDLHGGETEREAEIVRITPEGSTELFAAEVVFPNGSVITPDDKTLLVAETFAHRISGFRFDNQGRMASRFIWADLNQATPDGICLDEEGAVWVASPGTKELFRFKQGGEIVAQCETQGTPYACMLGGNNRRTLYICTSETDDPEEAKRLKSGRIECVQVASPGVGLP